MINNKFNRYYANLRLILKEKQECLEFYDDTIKLNNRYIKFVKKFDVKIILNCLNKIDSNRDKILNHIKKLSL